MKQALLIIDIQCDYFPGGAMELVGTEAAAANAAKLIAQFREHSHPIVHLQHIALDSDATFFRPDTKGAEIHESVKPLASEIVVKKNYPNGFRETDLLQHLRELDVDSLLIVGMMTQLCVDTTTRAAADLGFDCTLAHDACATLDLEFGGNKVSAADAQTAYLAGISGAFAKVVATGEVVA